MPVTKKKTGSIAGASREDAAAATETAQAEIGKLMATPLTDFGIQKLFRAVEPSPQASAEAARIRAAGAAMAHVVAGATNRDDEQREAVRQILAATLYAEQVVHMQAR